MKAIAALLLAVAAFASFADDRPPPNLPTDPTLAAAFKKRWDARDANIAAASALLDSWSGQPEILAAALKKLMDVLPIDQSNYRAIKEMARYMLYSGYLQNGWATYGRTVYVIGTYRPGILDAVESNVRRAIAINPSYADGYVFLAHVQHQQKKLDEAVASLAKAESIGTKDPMLHIYWANVEAARGNLAESERHWALARDAGTGNLRALNNIQDHMIANAAKSGDEEKAIALYRDLIDRNPSDAWMRSGFASYLSQTLGRNDEAIVEARAALKVMDHGAGRRILAMALYGKWADLVRQGDEAAAEPYFQEAVGLYPDLDEVMVYGASQRKGESLARALVAKKGVSVDARVEDGSTAILVSANLSRTKCVQYLLDMGADPNIPDQNGWTPILSAADEGDSKMVSLLLARGADVRARLRSGKDAAALAAAKGFADLAVYLQKREAEAQAPR